MLALGGKGKVKSGCQTKGLRSDTPDPQIVPLLVCTLCAPGFDSRRIYLGISVRTLTQHLLVHC